MTTVLSSINYALVLLYGALLSIDFAGGCQAKKKKGVSVAVICFILFMQMICAFSWGLEFTKKIYPFISHLPLVVFLVFGLKKPFGVALVSVLTAYFCCQLPRWVGKVVLFFIGTQNSYLLTYAISIVILLFLLQRYFVKPAYRAMTYSKQSLFLFGCLPLFYYLFDYATTIYTDALYQGIHMVSEFLPTAMALFYISFVVLYHKEVQRKNKIELDNTRLNMLLEQAASQIQVERVAQERARIYRHDLRHHLSLLSGFADVGDVEKIKDYLAQIKSSMDDVTPSRFCENETVNIIISSFDSKAKKNNVTLTANAQLPQKLSIPDAELCAVLSNGLENAINAASRIEDPELRNVRLDCKTNAGKLLILIQNVYSGKIEMANEIPVSNEEKHGFGCRSISAIAEKREGFCTFKAEDGIFTLRVALPIDE